MIIRKLNINNQLPNGQKPSFNKLQRLVVHQDGCIRLINFEHIEYIKADSNYCHIHLINHERLLISKTLKGLLEDLDNTFIRTHKSYIANMRHMAIYNIKDSLLRMSSGAYVTVSRTNKSLVKDLMT